MSSSEQAPEPTMDEILASIRKIISDDDPAESPQLEAAEAAYAGQDGPAEDGLSSDLAHALGDTQDTPDGGDDILDLTQKVEQLGGGEDHHGDSFRDALGDTGATDQSPGSHEPQGGQDADFGATDPEIAAILADAGITDTAGGSRPGEQPAAQQNTSGEAQDASFEVDAAPGLSPEPAAPQAGAPLAAGGMSASGQPVSGQESQGRPDSSIFGDEDTAPSRPQPSGPLAASLDKGAYAPEDTAAPVRSGAPGPADIPEPDAQSRDTGFGGFGANSGEAPAARNSLANSGGLAASAPVSGEAAQPADEAAKPDEVEAAADAAAADGAIGAGPRTLEDSVKDMLRPMLREWLDENMERIVHDAVRDEVGPGGLKGSGS